MGIFSPIKGWKPHQWCEMLHRCSNACKTSYKFWPRLWDTIRTATIAIPLVNCLSFVESDWGGSAPTWSSWLTSGSGGSASRCCANFRPGSSLWSSKMIITYHSTSGAPRLKSNLLVAAFSLLGKISIFRKSATGPWRCSRNQSKSQQEAHGSWKLSRRRCNQDLEIRVLCAILQFRMEIQVHGQDHVVLPDDCLKLYANPPSE